MASVFIDRLADPSASAPIIWCDNFGATYLSTNPIFHAHTKHVKVDYLFCMRQGCKENDSYSFYLSQDQLTFVFTKSLPTTSFTTFQFKFWVDPPPLA